MPHPKSFASLLCTARSLCLALCSLLCFGLSLPLATAQAAPLPDFEEEITLGMSEAQLRKLGASPCREAALCLTVRWGDQPWKAQVRMQGATLDVVELHPEGAGMTGSAAKELLDEFALSPVRVQTAEVQCDAFALVREGKSPEKAVELCGARLDALSTAAQYSVWYVDEDAVEDVLRAGSLEKTGSSHGRTVAARLSVTPGSVEVGYGHLGSLMQPGLKP